MKNFNVARDAWIPVLDMDNKFSYISPIELFSGQFKEFAGDEIQNYVMMLFCEAIVHSSEGCQPADIIEWRELKNVFAEKAIKYLNNNIDLFWMRGDKPFLQDISLLNNESIKFEPIKLRECTATGNNVVINTNQLTIYKEIRDVVLDLIVHQTFSMMIDKTKNKGKYGGKIMPSRWAVFSKSTNGNYNFYVTSNTLLNSIWLNLAYGVNFGKAVWETNFDSDTKTYCSQLIPLQARIYISDDLKSMKYGKGLEYSDYADMSSHLYKTIINKENRPFAVFNGIKVWKEFNSIILSNEPPIQLDKTRFESINSINIHGIGGNYKSTAAGLSKTNSIITSYYEIKSPSKLNDNEYETLYEKCIETTNNIIDLVNKSLITVNTNQSKIMKSVDKIEFKKLIWKYLDEKSFELFEYNDMSDLPKWNKIIMNACNNALDWVGSKCGYLAQYKISESKPWVTLIKELEKTI